MIEITPTHEILEWVTIVSIIVTFIITLFVLKKIGYGTLRIPIINFFIGTIIVGSSQLFYLTNIHHDHTVISIHLVWHAIFYLGIIAFVWGGLRLKQISNNPAAGLGKKKDIIVPALLILFSTIIWISSGILKEPFETLFMGSVFQSYGIEHYFALLLTSITALYMVSIDETMKKMLGINVYPILAFLYLMSFQHFLTGIFSVLDLSKISISEDIIDTQIQLIPILAFINLDYGYLQLSSAINKLRQKNQKVTLEIGSPPRP